MVTPPSIQPDRYGVPDRLIPGAEPARTSPRASGAAPDSRADFTPMSGGETAGQRPSGGNGDRPRLPRTVNGPRSRTGADRELRYRYARGLTERDAAIVRLVAQLGVLTTDQIAEAFFTGRKRAWERLTTLHEQGLLDRFRPFAVTGSAPHHYLLGKHGAVLAAVHDPDHPDHHDPARAGRRYRAGDATAMQTRSRLAHSLGVNGVCTALLAHARDNRDCRLIRWRTETQIARHYPHPAMPPPVRPDAFLVWRQYGDDLDAFLEYDRGTERPASRLRAKLDGYAKMEDELGASRWVLFAFTSHRHEATVRRDLADQADRLPIATATLDPELSPAEAIWRPLRATRHHTLIDLTLADKPKASLDRAGTKRAWRDWLTRNLDDEGEAW